MEQHEKRRLSDIVDADGFAFQLAVEYAVRGSADQHEWFVDSHEHPWREWLKKSGARQGYADFMAHREGGGWQAEPSVYIPTMRCVFECKRRSDGDFVFLIPKGDPPEGVHSASTLCTMLEKDVSGEGRHNRCWGWNNKIGFNLDVVESAFCCIKGKNDKRTTATLETWAGDLIAMTEAIAVEEFLMEGYEDERRLGLHGLQLYLPVLVTNVRLFSCVFEPSSVDLKTGRLGDECEFRRTPAVRFRKAFASSQAPSPENHDSFGLAAVRRSRSVFVIEADHLVTWLRQIPTDIHIDDRFGGGLFGWDWERF